MKFPRRFVAVVASILLLSGCASAPQNPAISNTPEPSVSASAEASQPASIVLSVSGLSILDQDGAQLSSATFDTPESVLALLTDLLGDAPEQEDSPKAGITYSWPGISFNEYVSVLVVDSAEIAGLPVATTQGITVGSSRSGVEALAPVAVYGTTDELGIEAQEAPGTESLAVPGQVGTAFVSVRLTGDVVTSIATPSGDYNDL